MLEGKTRDEIRQIINAGASLEINGVSFTSQDLSGLAHAAASSNGCKYLKIYNAKSKTTSELTNIAHVGGGKIIFS